MAKYAFHARSPASPAENESYSRFFEQVSDNLQDFGVGLVCVIESRSVNEDNGAAIMRVEVSDSSNL